MPQSFAANVHNLPVRERDRHHYNSNQMVFFCLCLEWFLLVSIMFLLNHTGWEIITGYCLIEDVIVTGGTILHLKHNALAGYQVGLTVLIMY